MMYIGDIEGFYEAMNCDCLGCLMDAVASGAISDEDMHEIISEQNADEMQTTPCLSAASQPMSACTSRA